MHFLHLEMNKVLGFRNSTIKKRGNCMHFTLKCNISETEYAFFALGNEQSFMIWEFYNKEKGQLHAFYIEMQHK